MTPEMNTLELLLIEDNPGDAHLFKKYLRKTDDSLLPERIGYAHRETLEDGVAALTRGSYDILLLDLGLPESDGLATLNRVLEVVDTVPVIVLTGLQNEELAVEAIKQGAQDYLTKNAVDADSVARAIRYAIERKDRERELQKRTDQLEVLNRIVRHDIQNDVNVIEGWTEQLRTHVDTPHHQTIEYIVESTTHITELTETVEDVLKGIADEGQRRLEPVAYDSILREEVTKKRTIYDEAQFSLETDLPSADVRANKLLSSVYGNLLSNAVEHSPTAGPCVEIEATVDQSRVTVSIIDNGPGISDDRKNEIFTKQSQGHSSAGTGIGLFLVETLVDQYGGSVWVEDSQLGGSKFTVELQRVT